MKTLNILHKKYIFSTIMLFVLLNCSINSVMAQLKPANAIYYFNEFLMNPALAGHEKVVNTTIGYRKQLTSFNNAPQNQFLAIDYGVDKKSAVGIKFNNDDAGLLRQTSLAATYAFHLPLNKTDKLSFGISASVNDYRLNISLLEGDINDPEIDNVNQRKLYLDTDFGMAYRTNNLTMQVSFPNMISSLNVRENSQSNYALFFSAIGYKFNTNLGIVEPKIVYRGIKGFKSILDIGTNVVFESATDIQFNLFGLYHTSNNATAGFGVNFNQNYSFKGSYTFGTSQLIGYSNGDFELGIGFRL